MRIAFTLTWKKVLAAGFGAVVLALAVSFSGLVSIAASTGHYSIVGWFLHWTMQNSVDRQSMLISVPEGVDLADPALVQRTAGHFATGCASCHGAPGVPQSPVVLSMTPHPPRLEKNVGEWKDRELFWIVKHGIKYSGMPAWVTQDRDDEVWAQVAFLRALPDMTAERYTELALGGTPAGSPAEPGGEAAAASTGVFETALADCSRCHGRDGLGRGSGDAAEAFPVIAAQPKAYLLATLKAFSTGARQSGLMQPPARRYDDATLAALADWYASQPRTNRSEPALRMSETAGGDGIPRQILPHGSRSESAIVASAAAGNLPPDRAALLDLGRMIAQEGIAARKIPACESCHGLEGRSKNDHYPYINGQPEWYAKTHLELWKEEERGGTHFSHLMSKIAIHLTDEQIEAVSAWYAEQGRDPAKPDAP
ncbi:cytochrome c [Skermanella aerolata]|uniref:Cytochrome c n=1 Tax=Skermanella aerolata TaxID=393310 RepID=A0A512DPH5_9PROT|nr:c-type cytochrome [Skermanella aerolata]KJB94440.1 cytochrome C553 [Skermanella aerolata KACC 11604]GEO38030.1 cytochrome c [Skermanella aerolata]